MQVLGVEGVPLARVVFADVEGLQDSVEVLHVGDVSAEADDGGVGESAEAFHIGEAGEGAV